MSSPEWLQQAQQQINLGHLDQALETCQTLLAHFPNEAIAYSLIGSIQEQKKQYGFAMEAYRQAIRLQPSYAEAYVYLAQLYRDVGWINEAVIYYQKALKLRWNWPEIQDHLGCVLQRQGKLQAAIRHHQVAIQQNPNYVQAYINLALRLNEHGQIEPVIQLLEKTITRFPNCSQAYNNLGCLLLEKKQPESALPFIQTSVKLDPESASGYNNLGQAWMALGNITEAIRAYQQALKLDPELMTAYHNLGKVWQQQNQHQKAVDCFQKVLEFSPENLLLYGDCGYSLMAQGKWDEAMICFQTAIAIEPKWVHAFCQRFGSFSSEESPDDQLLNSQIACAQFLEYLQQFDCTHIDSKIYDKLAQVYFYCGNVLVEYGQASGAIFYYQKALQIQPNWVEVYLQLGFCFAQQKRWNAAIAVCHFAQNLPNQSETFDAIYFLLGYCCEQQNRWQSALKYYHKILESSSTTLQKFYSNFNLRANTHQNSEQQPPTEICLSTLAWLKKHQISETHYLALENHQSSQHYAEADSSPCAGLECHACVEKIFKNLELIHLGHNIHTYSHPTQILDQPFNKFVAILPQGRAWITPKINAWNVCKAIAIMTSDHQLLADVSRDYPGQLPGCQRYHPQQHQVFQQSQLPPLQKINGSVAVLSGLSGHIYFHWMVDVLPRIELLRRSGINLNQIDKFLVNSTHLSFQQKTLKQLGIPSDKILASDQFPHIQANQLIVPSFPGYLGWLEPWGIQFLRHTFLTSAIQAKSGYPERIYISRNSAKHRRVLNETEVMETLKTFGFVSLQLESISLTEQVALFYHAKVIIAPHGSGLTNIVFCQPSAQIAEFVSPHYNRHYYWVISQALGLKHYSLMGEAFPCYPLRTLMYQNPLTEDIWVNLTDLQQLITVMKLS